MEPERIDLSPLDPSRNPQRWDRMVRSITTRAVYARRHPRSIHRQLAAWRLPAFGLAAGLAAAVWVVSALSAPGTESPSTTVDSAFMLANWAMQGEIPADSSIHEILGGAHESW